MTAVIITLSLWALTMLYLVDSNIYNLFRRFPRLTLWVTRYGVLPVSVISGFCAFNAPNYINLIGLIHMGIAAHYSSNVYKAYDHTMTDNVWYLRTLVDEHDNDIVVTLAAYILQLMLLTIHYM